MILDFKKAVFLGFLALNLAACQSAPDDDGLDTDVAIAAEGDGSGAEAYGTGDRDGVDGMGMGADGDAMADGSAQSLLDMRVFYFDFDQAVVRSEAIESLREHARYLNENPSAVVRLEGHADERGTREYNVALGERRGNAVQKYLRLNGVAAAQMEVVSYGEEKPVLFGHDDASWSANRRVELVYTSMAP